MSNRIVSHRHANVPGGPIPRVGHNKAVQVAMLGPLEVRTDDDSGITLDVGGSRLRSLLIMLALRPGHLVPARQLIDGLWASQPPAGAANALQALVSRLRRALPDAVIESRPAGYQLKLDPRSTDIVRFEELAAQGRAQLRDDPATAAATLREALALWRGPALMDVADSDFGRAVIARLDELRLLATENRVDADLRTGVTATLVAELEGLVVAHPMREPLAARLMRALHACGRRGAALQVYEQTKERLVEQLGIEPSADLAALHLSILRADDPPAEAPQAEPPQAEAPQAEAPQAEPPPEARFAPQASPGRSNLRAELTSFVGRGHELAQVAELLSANRLVTLTGPGGAGKTRLAAEAARAEVAAMPDGVWLVELAPVTDPADLISAVLSVLGLREQALLYAGKPLTARLPPGQAAAPDEQADALGRLLTALAAQRTLLVLDNCEHLIEAAATLADRILAACPQVRILATSREPLNITGEALWTVGPLTLPPDPAVSSDTPERTGPLAPRPTGAPPGIGAYASVSLLIQRARAVFPEFALTEANAPAVARICRALDGMPLAIELAAARLRTMAPEQVAARLDGRFQLLTGGSRTAMPRHQTLRAVVDWSWELLDEAERTLWRRFSVFSGGATLEAAEQVCGGRGISADQVLDLLTALADKSLLTVRPGADGARYRMLEIIRAYGQERLTEVGEHDELRQAHARHFTQLAEASMDYLLGAQQLDWLRKLSDDQDNLHGAIRGAIAAGDGQAAVGLAGALGWYWSLRSMKVEGAELIAMAVDLPRGPADAGRERLAVAYAMGGLLAMDTPLIGRVQGWFEAAADIAAAIPDSREPVLRLIGPLRALFGAFATGRRMPSPAVFDKAVADPEPWVSGAALVLRGHMTVNCGRQHVQAEEDFLAATGIFTGLGERWGLAIALGGLAMLEGWRGEHAAAVGHYRQAVELVAELGSTEDEIVFRLCLTRELWLLGERKVAHAELARAQRDAERLRLPEAIALGAYTAGDLARLEGRTEAARAALRRVVEQEGPLDMAQLIRAQAATGLGYLAAADGDLEAARGWHARALDAARSSSDAPVIAQALTGLADLALREDAPDRAAELLGASLAVRGTTDRSVLDEKRVAHDVRAMLGDARYADAYQRGQRVTIDTLAALIELTPGA
jgi:predicted ATPase/DNA-binding SARP family transcriptional activator/tetratricopeptide (TPR) repeat protein